MGIVRTRTGGMRPTPRMPEAEGARPSRAPSAPRRREDAFERGAGSASVALEGASRLRRSDGPEGVEPILTAHESQRVDRLLRARPDVKLAVEAVSGDLTPVQSAILLRAVSARAEVLAAGPDATALGELTSLAKTLRGLDDEEARRHATSLDLDSTTNHSAVDPLAWWGRRGSIRAPRGDVHAADNDGLFQRFTASCGTTVVQMMLAEADPAYALFLHQHGIQGDDVTGPIADFQKRLLEAGGGIAMGRQEALLRSRLRNALGRLHAGNEVTLVQKEALLAHALKGAPLTTSGRRALEACRERYAGFPSADELVRLRQNPIPNKDEGLATESLIRALEQVITPRTGIRYRSTHPVEGFARGQAGRHLDAVEAALRRGVDVPFGISEPAHWMLLSAVKGREPRREFLVSDPDGGRTAWVTEKDFLSGAFGSRIFQLSRKDERPYVDTFILPVLER
ncbi:MAG: hypothetical protein AB2A00_03110 [Myxococcota bacterium]